MSTRARIGAFGSAATLVIVGIVAAALITDGTGQYVAISLAGLGLVAVVSFVFLEIGLSEDRELARRAERRKAPRRPSRKLTRSRGQRRRLR